MKCEIYFFAVFYFIINFINGQVNPNEHLVSGYTTKTGKVVESYYRTNQNSTNIDNFGTMPNINPHTGKIGTILPDNNYINSPEPINIYNYNPPIEINYYPVYEKADIKYIDEYKSEDININENNDSKNYSEQSVNFIDLEKPNNNTDNYKIEKSHNSIKTQSPKKSNEDYGYSIFELIVGGILYLFGFLFFWHIITSTYNNFFN